MAKKKKMTTKQFKELVNFDIYGWEGILNQIILADKANAKELRVNGLNNGADYAEKQAHEKYMALKALGYYD